MACKATIVLLLKNGERFLPETLPAIFNQQVDFEYEVLVIDSGSTDRSLKIVSDFPARLVQIPPETFNHGETRNLGAQLANEESEYIVYLSQDAKPADPVWLACLIAPLIDSRVAGAFSRHLPRPDTSPALVRQMALWQTGGKEKLWKEKPEQPEAYERDKFFYIYFSNTSSAIRREVWKGLPFRRVSFAEDAVWADEALRAGYRIVYQPESAVIHSHDYPCIEQFRQNVDHTHAMKVLFNPPGYARSMTLLRQIRAIPRQVWRDWYFILHSPQYQRVPAWQKIRWLVHSPGWQMASALGAYIGAHLETYPASLRQYLSRQERIRQA